MRSITPLEARLIQLADQRGVHAVTLDTEIFELLAVYLTKLGGNDDLVTVRSHGAPLEGKSPGSGLVQAWSAASFRLRVRLSNGITRRSGSRRSNESFALDTTSFEGRWAGVRVTQQ